MLHSKWWTELERLSLIAEPSENPGNLWTDAQAPSELGRFSLGVPPTPQGPLTKKGGVKSVLFNTETLLFTARARSWAFPEFIQGPRGCEGKGQTQSYRLATSLCCLGRQANLH